eukprot:1079421-Prorocentrum_minimum.AAC.1
MQDVWVYTRDGPIGCRTRGYILVTEQSDAGRTQDAWRGALTGLRSALPGGLPHVSVTGLVDGAGEQQRSHAGLIYPPERQGFRVWLRGVRRIRRARHLVCVTLDKQLGGGDHISEIGGLAALAMFAGLVPLALEIAVEPSDGQRVPPRLGRRVELNGVGAVEVRPNPHGGLRTRRHLLCVFNPHPQPVEFRPSMNRKSRRAPPKSGTTCLHHDGSASA